MVRFQIHRLDDPTAADQHYRAFWRIDGQTFRVHAWRLEEWLRLSPEHRPRDAHRIQDHGWMTLRPIQMRESQDQRLAYLSPSPVSSH